MFSILAIASLCLFFAGVVAQSSEQRISLNKLAQREGVNVSTCWRWVQRGVRNIRLRSISVGARRFVEQRDWEEFVAATTAAAQDEQIPPLETRTNRARQASVDRAERELDDAGA